MTAVNEEVKAVTNGGNVASYQPHLSPNIPTVINNKDYQEFRTVLEKMDNILVQGGIETDFVRSCLDHKEQELANLVKNEPTTTSVPHDVRGTKLSVKSEARLKKMARKALRCNIARKLVGDSFRDFSNRLADSALLQWFCLIDTLAVIQVPTKSTLERFDKIVPDSTIEQAIDQMTVKAMAPGITSEDQPLGLEKAITVDEAYIDTSCIKANIHFPVDWVLLRDIVIRLISLIMIIRQYGIISRMPNPKSLVRAINRLCIEMTHTRHKKGGKKERKRILRLMKLLVKRVRVHAERYRKLLTDNWSDTDLSEKEKDLLLGRLNKIIEQIPKAVKQAHERIIGERSVKNKDKILSLHESEIHVIVRRKSGSEVEFGNTWVIVEQADGIIIYSKLIKDQAKADSKLLEPALEHIVDTFGSYPDRIGADRGFDSDEVRTFLSGKNIYNGVCPRNPATLKERLKDETFCDLQKRRSQTEGRIGIFKNRFLSGMLRSKGFVHRQLGVAWAVFAHNLWALARLSIRQQEELLLSAAA
jgi:hypothetical protein